jgi:outer membrane protein assembly factor BamB
MAALPATSARPSARLCLTATALLLALAAGVILYLVRAPIPSPPAGPHIVWTFEPPERGAVIASPAVVGDRVYVAAIRDNAFAPAGVVYCLERETGKVVWQFTDDGGMQHMFSSPVLADGRLYIGEGMHANFRCKLYCLNADTGTKLWHFEVNGHIESTPCVAAGRVFFGAGDDGLYCLDAVSGAEVWHFAGPYHIDLSPTVVDGRVYAGSGVSRRNKTTEAFCLEAATGRVVWRYPAPLPVWGSPLVSGDQVCFGLGTGRLERSADPGEVPAGALLCLDAATGQHRWTVRLSEAVFGQPAADDARVYFGARDGWLRCVARRDGAELWRADLGSPIIATPVLCAGRLYVMPAEGRFTCFDAVSGQQHWSFDLAQHSQTKPRIYATPSVLPAEGGVHRRIYLGMELRNPATSAAVVYCMQD